MDQMAKERKVPCLNSSSRKVESRTPVAHFSHSVSQQMATPKFSREQRLFPCIIGRLPNEIRDFTKLFESFDCFVVCFTNGKETHAQK